MSPDDRPWLFCQLGAREHYVLPRELHRRGFLKALITEAWAPPSALGLPGLHRRFADRYAPELAQARVEHFTTASLAFEVGVRLRRQAPAGWPAIMARNAWFERHAVERMRRHGLLDDKPNVFAYSYAALGILQAAREAGCRTVLGQIDPAVTEENIVSDAVARHADLRPRWGRAPGAYWDRWRQECALADRIMVNSAWARDGLTRAGIDPAKLRVVPLAYEAAARSAPRLYPAQFTPERPLRVLFLGSLVIRKGIAEVLEAAALLAEAPVEFHLVGHDGITFPAEALANPKIIRHGPASRGTVAAHYAAADLFILPSLSDGFGLTQIEAQAHGLPVIASRRCGEVVEDGVNGLLLDEVTGAAIAAAVSTYLAAPSRLTEQSAAALKSLSRFEPSTVGEGLLHVLAQGTGQ